MVINVHCFGICVLNYIAIYHLNDFLAACLLFWNHTCTVLGDIPRYRAKFSRSIVDGKAVSSNTFCNACVCLTVALFLLIFE